MAHPSYALADRLAESRAAIRETDQVIRQHSKTFYFATALLPPDQRHAIRALYAFCRASDDLVDSKNTRIEDFIAWQTAVDLPVEKQSHPLLAAWAQVRSQYAVDRVYEQELLEGMRMDLQFSPYPTFEDLKVYCYRVASTVGLMAMPIIGLAPGATLEQAKPYAIHLGIALQLTNILRDVGEDIQRGRMYLPLEDLDRFGLSVEQIHNRVYDQRFIALMQYEIQRARELYRQALPGVALLAASARPAVYAAAMLYERILGEIEAIQYRVFQHRAHTRFWQKVALLPKILFNAL